MEIGKYFGSKHFKIIGENMQDRKFGVTRKAALK